jgi:hypothetical protein
VVLPLDAPLAGGVAPPLAGEPDEADELEREDEPLAEAVPLVDAAVPLPQPAANNIEGKHNTEADRNTGIAPSLPPPDARRITAIAYSRNAQSRYHAVQVDAARHEAFRNRILVETSFTAALVRVLMWPL